MRKTTIVLAALVAIMGVLVSRRTAHIIFPQPPLKAHFTVHEAPAVKLDAWDPGFGDAVLAELAAGDYAKLEARAAAYRQPDAFFASGIPKLDVFYRVLSGHGHEVKYAGNCRTAISEAAFQKTLPQLEAWQKATGSFTATTALAALWLAYGWEARTCTYSDKIGEDQAKTIDWRVGHAVYLLDNTDAERDPEVNYLLTEAGMMDGGSRYDMDRRYARGIANFPWYLPYYAQHAIELLRAWYGWPGEERRYLNTLWVMTQPVNGRMAYAYAVDRLETVFWPTDQLFSPPVGIDYRQAVEAYQYREATYGLRDRDWAVLFSFAAAYRDDHLAQLALSHVKQRSNPDIWLDNPWQFETWVKWYEQELAKTGGAAR